MSAEEMQSPYDSHIGTEWLSDDPDRAQARVAVTEKVTQPYGLVHGGVISALAESLCSRATAIAVAGDGMGAFGQSSHASFLRPITAGHVNAAARARHRGRTTWVWEVEVTDDEGRLCALVAFTAAVRPLD
jgi:1,4-dihydroxy-2-naphthoyl-CoA hydrolase